MKEKVWVLENTLKNKKYRISGNNLKDTISLLKLNKVLLELEYTTNDKVEILEWGLEFSQILLKVHMIVVFEENFIKRTASIFIEAEKEEIFD